MNSTQTVSVIDFIYFYVCRIQTFERESRYGMDAFQ